MGFDLIAAWITVALSKVRPGIPDAFWCVGLALVALGVGLYSLPAGVITAGLACCFAGYAGSK